MKQPNCKLKPFKICSVLQFYSRVHSSVVRTVQMWLHLTQDILVTNILHQQLTKYMWNFYTARAENDNWNRRGRTQVQREGVVYSHDVDHNIAGTKDCLQAWESLNLSQDQKLYRLIFSYSVLSQLMLHIKKLKKATDQSAVNTLRRMTRREEKKENEEDHVNSG